MSGNANDSVAYIFLVFSREQSQGSWVILRATDTCHPNHSQ